MRTLGRRGVVFLGFAVAAAVLAAAVWVLSFAAALDQIARRGAADLSHAADRLTGELQRISDVAVHLSEHPGLRPVEAGRALPASADALLQRFVDRTTARRVRVADPAGRIVAASDGGRLGDLTARPEFTRAMDGALGRDHWADPVTGARVFTVAAPIFAADGPVEGAVLVEVDLAQIEWNWPAGPTPAFFTTDTGRVLVSNRSDLIGTSRRAGAEPAFPLERSWHFADYTVWRLGETPYLPGRALFLETPLLTNGLTAGVLADIWPALRLAKLQAAVAAALVLAVGGLVVWLGLRRRALALRLEIEERANAALEARVAERTEALEALNRDLRHEIGERQEAEAALRRAQADLVQAGKLSALGQMSAGISHELNQPLMAIQSFAENGAEFLKRGAPERAGENLTRIGALARQMGRIIRNLRAFARQEPVEVTDVDLGAVVDAALELAAPRLTAAGVTVDWARPGGPVLVRGGAVRLQQVLLNLLGNAADAMEVSPARHISITLGAGDPVVLSVADTGPGIAAPEKIFDPFYTTKEVGAAEGLGLGLSISYGLVQSFGGVIRGRNRPEGGAVFTVELTPAAAERAA